MIRRCTNQICKNYISLVLFCIIIDFFISAKASKLSREERLVLCIGDIINDLILANQEGRDVNLNSLKTRLSSKYGLETSPRLVDIIAAVPHDHKKTLVPKLKAKPVRTASGVSWTFLGRDFKIVCFPYTVSTSVKCSQLATAL